MGRADIEDALKRLDNLIREEHRAATAEVLLVTSELRDGVQPFQHDFYTILKLCLHRFQQGKCDYATDRKRCGRSKVYAISSFVSVMEVKSSSQGIRYNRTFVNGSRLRTHRRIITLGARPIIMEQPRGSLKAACSRIGSLRLLFYGSMENASFLNPFAVYILTIHLFA